MYSIFFYNCFGGEVGQSSFGLFLSRHIHYVELFRALFWLKLLWQNHPTVFDTLPLAQPQSFVLGSFVQSFAVELVVFALLIIATVRITA